MTWRLLGRPKTQKVTKALATQFAEMDPAPHDRPLSERRLQVYQRLLKDGSFRPVTWASALCVETSGVYRVNGKHTSTMLAGIPTLPDFYVTVEEYECDTLEDVARLYATFDSKLMSRTTRDINLSFAATVNELIDISDKTINIAVSGMAYHIYGLQWSKTQPAERAELLLEHSDFVVWLGDGILGTPNDRATGYWLFRQPVVAAMFATWSKAKAASTEFWKAVREETGPKPDLPDRKIAKYLSTHALGTGSNKGPTVRRADHREMYVKCLHAWNAWRRKETTNLNYYPTADVPAVK